MRAPSFGAAPRFIAVAAGLSAVMIGVVAGVSAATPKRHLGRVTSVTFVGHGWGPGVGMGQWGAFGYAVRYHFGYERILNHYYGKTVSGSLASTSTGADPTISVAILENLNLATNVGYDPVVTASTPFTITSNGGTPVVPTTTTTTVPTGTTGTTVPTTSTTVSAAATSFTVPAGMAIDLQLAADGTWNAYEASTCSGATSATTTTAPIATGLVDPVVAPTVAATAPVSQLLVLCRHDGVSETLRGSIEAYDRSGYERTLNLVPLESYLLSVVPAESSASWGTDGSTVNAPLGRPWGFQALEAQAIAARSYAMAYAQAGGWNGYASICDTTLCQVYAGANYENAVSDASVSATTGEIRVSPSAPTVVVSTPFSASTGGFTTPSAFPPVHDLGDACVVRTDPSECNPNHTWEVTVNGVQIMRHYRRIGRLMMVHVSARNGYGAFGGRAVTVVLKGTKGALRVPADAFASALGLKSDWFAIAKATHAGENLAAATTTTIVSGATSTTSTSTSTSTSTTTTTTIAPTGTAPTTTIPVS